MKLDRSLKVFSLWLGFCLLNSVNIRAEGFVSNVNSENSFTRSPAIVGPVEYHGSSPDKSVRRPLGKKNGELPTECGLTALPSGYRGTLGGTGLVNGYYFNKEKKLCEATRDFGSATPRGPFETVDDCETAVATGQCAP